MLSPVSVILASSERVNFRPRPSSGCAKLVWASALSFGERYGILTNLDDDINGELRLLRTLGLEARLAGIEAVGIKVPDLVDTPEVFEALLAGARRLERRGARVVVLGCAGMTPFAQRLRQETGLWIIDPLMSAVGLATAAV
ncbi:aspartate/glutamate racemase family protein [Mesorhizobium sp. YC-39]|uniref:aspartate/glutamate racemase family protein n=1 Tax=unclassified Mesorhizobium TaxID=325217 RepID=UPI0021E79ECC|nr:MULTISPECIES: aspartate/glutamate racemase family protein [unclassified Mesorhizobium]MCV3207378.1 aspartate/glutamate racemase family protein [Mesorhizobium sp. YC-2]MCV3229105.1 aspartate/glutamate racemase family protein [Mesorhizobium sp. YC-39]